MLKTCLSCGTRYAWTLSQCPWDGSTDYLESGQVITITDPVSTDPTGTLTAGHCAQVDTTSTDVTRTLPTASAAGVAGAVLVRKVDGSANTVTIERAGADTITDPDGVTGLTSYVISGAGGAAELRSDGVDTWIVTRLIIPDPALTALFLSKAEGAYTYATQFYGTAAELSARGIPGPGIQVYETDTTIARVGDGITGVASLPLVGSATYVPVVSPSAGHRLMSLGDSITIAGDVPEPGQYVMRADSIFQTLTCLSGGAISFVRNAGVGGNTTAQMLARFDTDVTPYAPTMVSVLGGTNDFTFSVSDATFQANVRALVAKIRGIGAIPLLFTPPPVNSFGTSDRAKVIRNGRWMLRYAAANGIPCVDTFGVLVDPATTGNYLAAYDNGDGIHPSVAGRLAIGTAAWNTLKPLLPLVNGTYTTCKGDPTNLALNALFLDGSTGGFPVDWFAGDTPSSGTGANSIITDAAMPGGKALRLTATAMTGGYSVRFVILPAAGFTGGDIIEISALVNNALPTSAQARLFCSYDVDRLHITSTSLQGRFLHRMEIKTPPTATAIFLNCSMSGLTAGSGTVDFGGVALRNLTTEGNALPI
jgi:lysophospholipase L1-like esterase